MKVGIFGYSGFAREVADICVALKYTDIFFISEDIQIQNVNGFSVVKENILSDLPIEQIDFAIGAGSNKIRKKIAEKYRNLNFVNLIHPTATFGSGQAEKVQEKKGNIICAGVRFTNNIQMGNFGIYNLNCTVGHDCIIEDYINVNPGVNISGNVNIRPAAFIGTNSCIIQGKSDAEKLIIGENAIIGAGSVVIKNVDPDTTVVGAPAKPISK